MLPTRASMPLVARQSGIPANSSAGDVFLDIIHTQFDSQFHNDSIYSSVIFSLGAAALLTLAFSLIRPYHTVVYAPRAKYADSKHAPPPVRQGLFGWFRTITGVREAELVEKLGLDAALFMRFVRMMRNIFSILTIVGCGILIPTTLISSNHPDSVGGLSRLTPQAIYFSSPHFWVYVVVIYIFNIVVCYFLWRNYGAVLRLRREYFESDEYQRSLPTGVIGARVHFHRRRLVL